MISNSYTGFGGASSGGIIVVGGSCYGSPESVKSTINSNVVIGNDVGIWLSNFAVDPLNPNNCIPRAVMKKIIVNKNIATNDYINNTSGDGPGMGYQAGISDQGTYDKLTNNTIGGAGIRPIPLLRVSCT